MQACYDEISAVLNAVPVATVVASSDGKIILNSAAKLLFNEKKITIKSLKKSLSHIIPGETIIQIIQEEFLVDCRSVDIHSDSLKLYFFKKQSEQTESENIYKACLDSITDLHIIACDSTGKIQFYNDLSAKLDNIKKEDALGSNIFDLFQSKTESSIRTVLRTGQPVLDWSSTYISDGQEIPCLGSSYPVKLNGKLAGAISINRSNAATRDLLMRTIELQKQLVDSSGKNMNGTSYTFESIIGISENIKETVEFAKRAANSTAPVMIYGETGTGKELFAQSIHNASVRNNKPFVAINCAAIPETLLESTLFGTSKGAFTGSDNSIGLIEQAGEGTLFMDEVNSLSINLQAKLLRVLQERTFRRVGGSKDILVKCRILSACNCNPLECVNNNTIRKDLYYRLAVVCIEVPPLRDRKEDIMVLSNYFLNAYAKIYGVHHIKISKQLQMLFDGFSWPGNIRELRHVIESSLFRINSGEELELKHLPDIFVQQLLKNQDKPQKRSIELSYPEEPYNLEEKLRELKKNAILKALEASGGNVSHAAKLIGYSRTTLQYQMEKLEIGSWQKDS